MAVLDLSLTDALKTVRGKRPSVKPNAALSRQLMDMQFSGELRGPVLGGPPGGRNPLFQALDLAVGGSAPLALEDGSAKHVLDELELERAVAQLGEVLPVPAELRREVLVKHSGNVERAASELLAWLEGGPGPSASRGAASSSAAAGPSSSAAGASLAGGVLGAWRQAAAASSSSSSSTTAAVGGSSSAQKALEVSCPEASDIVKAYLGAVATGADDGPECVICGSAGPRRGDRPEPHQDLGWVHSFCLKQATG